MWLPVLALGLLAPPSGGEFGYQERLHLLDLAWDGQTAEGPRIKAVGFIETALKQKVAKKYAEACHSLDLAAASLLNRNLRREDAVDVRTTTITCDPGGTVQLTVNWAYQPVSHGSVRVGIGERSLTLRDGQSLLVSIKPWDMSPELQLTPECGYTIPIQIGAVTKFAYVSILGDALKRAYALGSQSKNLVAKSFGLAATSQMADDSARPSVLDAIFQGEHLLDGSVKADDITQFPMASDETGTWRATLPNGVAAGTDMDVVIALPAEGMSPNEYFEGYGQGRAVSEATKRGWAFIAVSGDSKAPGRALQWLQDARGIKPRKVFLIGHGSGADQILALADQMPNITAVALFGPNKSILPASLASKPIYATFGAQDSFSAKTKVALDALLKNRPECKVETVPACDHMMIVASGLDGAYTFLEHVVR